MGENNYLKETIYCDSQNILIKQKAEEITKDLHDKRDMAITIFYWVRDNIKYRVGFWQKSASDTLKNGVGTCTNKANLFVAFCRAKNIPSGYGIMKVYGQEYFGPIVLPLFKKKINEISTHVYACCFLENKWVRCDPSADRELSEKTSYFNSQSTLVDWNGYSDAMEKLQDNHIISDNYPLNNIDNIISKKHRRGKKNIIKIANLYIKFLRENNKIIKDPNCLQNLFVEWLKAKYFLLYLFLKYRILIKNF